jgi:serine protease Do
VAVDEQSPAAVAGIRRGDVILVFDGKPVADKRALFLLAARAPVGTAVPVQLVRDGQRVRIDVPIGRRPAEKPR